MDMATELQKIIEDIAKSRDKLEQITNQIYELIDELDRAEAKRIAREHQEWMEDNDE